MQRLLLFASLLCCAVAADLERRQAVASTQCAGRDNTWAICSPEAGETWYNGSYHEFTWKYDNSVFTSYTTLILYLMQVNNNNNYTTVKTWPNVPRTPGVLVEQVDSTWFPSPLADNSPNKTWSMAAYIMPPDIDIQADLAKIPSKENRFPPPVQFNLIQNAHNTTSSTPSSPTPSTLATQNSSANNGLQPWLIAVICVACVLGTAAAAACIWYARRKMKKDSAEPSHGEASSEKLETHSLVPPPPLDGDSIRSSTPMMQHVGSNNLTPSASNRNITDDLRSSNVSLSQKDAVMISDAFKQNMRNPVWNTPEYDEENEQPAGSGSEHDLPMDSLQKDDHSGLPAARSDHA